MEKLLRITLVLFVLIGLAACGGSNEPEKVVTNFYQNIANKKFDQAINTIYIGDLEEAEMTQAKGKLNMMLTAAYADMEKNGGYKSTEIKEVKLSDDGKRATVLHIVHLNKRDRTETIKLININGEWKIIIK